MSYDHDSYQQGQTMGLMAGFAANRELDKANGAVREWRAYARQLESQLELANLNLVRARAGQEANNEVVRELRQHVAMMNPRDPMGSREYITPMLRSKIREKVERQGYRVVNPETLDIAAR